MRYRTNIEVPDEVTIGDIKLLRSHLDGFGVVSALLADDGISYVEFTLDVEDLSKASSARSQPWIVGAAVGSDSVTSSSDRAAMNLIDRYLKLADLWEDVTSYCSELGFTVPAPTHVEIGRA